MKKILLLALITLFLNSLVFALPAQVSAACSGVCVTSPNCARVGRSPMSGSCGNPAQVCCSRFSALCEAAKNCPTDPAEQSLCYTCMCDEGGTWTDLGCINTRSISGIIISVVRIIFGIIGGIALVLLISVGYLYQTGKTENVEKAKQRIVALFSAVIFLVFSTLLLRIIGVNILDVTTPGIIN